MLDLKHGSGKTFINGSYGAVKTTDGKILQFVKEKEIDGEMKFKQIALADFVTGDRGDEKVTHTRKNGLWFESGKAVATYSIPQIIASYQADPDVHIRSEKNQPRKKKKK